MEDILQILQKEKPKFQIKGSVLPTKSAEDFFFKGGRSTEGIERVSAALPMDGLNYINSVLTPDMVTLEVGGGQSTVLISSKVKKHYCVNPDVTANQLIRQYLEKHGRGTENLVFIEDSSDSALPVLKIDDKLDFVFLDGNHSFPLPFIDWFYSNKLLKVGGIMVIDNVEINAVRYLDEYLQGEPAYRLLKRIRNDIRYDCVAYEKVKEELTMGWKDQRINHSTLIGYSWRTTINYLYNSLKNKLGLN